MTYKKWLLSVLLSLGSAQAVEKLIYEQGGGIRCYAPPRKLEQVLSQYSPYYGSSVLCKGLQLTGELTDQQMEKLKNIDCLNLSDNQITGDIPGKIVTLKNLKALKLQGNHLSGPIPQDLFCTSLHKIDLSHNALTGEVPCQTNRSLYSLDLSYNALSGEVRQEIFNSSLSFLLLNGNPHLRGALHMRGNNTLVKSFCNFYVDGWQTTVEKNVFSQKITLDRKGQPIAWFKPLYTAQDMNQKSTTEEIISIFIDFFNLQQGIEVVVNWYDERPEYYNEVQARIFCSSGLGMRKVQCIINEEWGLRFPYFAQALRLLEQLPKDSSLSYTFLR